MNICSLPYRGQALNALFRATRHHEQAESFSFLFTRDDQKWQALPCPKHSKRRVKNGVYEVIKKEKTVKKNIHKHTTENQLEESAKRSTLGRKKPVLCPPGGRKVIGECKCRTCKSSTIFQKFGSKFDTFMALQSVNISR